MLNEPRQHSDRRPLRVRVAVGALVVVAAFAFSGCSGEVSPVDRAQAQVTAKEKAVKEARSAADAASQEFCQASKTYIEALDRYGDILTQTAPTVGDVKDAGSDLAKPRSSAFDGAEAAVEAHQELATAEQELVAARAALDQARGEPSGTPEGDATPQPTATPLVPSATVDRVKQADAEFASAQSAITDQTTVAAASEQFNSAAVALEFSWLHLFAQAGCIPDAQAQEASAAVSRYVTELQQSLAAAGYYSGAIDGVYGPQTVAAVEELQTVSGLPVTGTVDKATAAALDATLLALGGAAAQTNTATTAALQQTLKLAGFWSGPVDGVWTPALTESLQAFQAKLGVEATGTVDAATISAFDKALAEAQQAQQAPSATPTPSP
ncbi:peptidoglycan-binding domain-containing protein [Cryocola sp. 340MFSha3.1]|uniref:peptidoglycan-binding domain-containing protein n=1 Tax=Cryocola sp. 340MFSha3.1 TaxID=1169145 RepID=UPI0003715AAD|nr:peptidoglycan-binding domain-containing protein [Cryocola sp. 340MFSha3.1]